MTTILGLLLLAWLLASFEILVPGGVLGLFAAVALGFASWFAYEPYGLTGSLLVFMLGGVFLLISVALELKWIKKTRFGNRFVLSSAVTGRSESMHATDNVIGKDAVTLTTMAPTGMIQIDNDKYEAFSRSGMLSAGETVRVVDRDNFRLIIEKP